MNVDTSIKRLARLIYESPNSIDLFSVHETLGFDPGEILMAASFFVEEGVARIDGTSLTVLAGAKQWIRKRRREFFLDDNRPWSETALSIPDPSEPYLPKLGKVDQRFFSRYVAPVPLE